MSYTGKFICLSWPLSVKHIFDWHMSIFLTSWANQVLHSLASRGLQNPGFCLQDSVSFLPEVPLFQFLALVSYAKPKIPFLCLSLLWNQMEMLATQATQGQTPRLQDVSRKVRWSGIVQDRLWGALVLVILETKRKLHRVNFCEDVFSLNVSSPGRKRKESLQLRL